MSRTCIVGDVHGMLPELIALLELAALTPADTLVSCGDLVDKGPDSAGVVRHMRSLRDTGQPVVLVLGNHEEKHARFRKAVAAAPPGSPLPKIKGAEEIHAITQALAPEDIAFLDSAVPFHVLSEHNALVVHAGVLPSTMIPTLDEYAAMSKGEREKFLRILRVRHLTGKPSTKITVEFQFPFEVRREDDAITAALWASYAVTHKSVRPVGDFVSLGAEGPEDPFWAETYDGKFGQIYFGHSPFPTAPTPPQWPHATGLDLGCVFGGRLAAAILELGKEPQHISVPSRGKFAASFWEDQ